MFAIALSLENSEKLTIEEYNFCNNSFGSIIPDSCEDALFCFSKKYGRAENSSSVFRT